MRVSTKDSESRFDVISKRYIFPSRRKPLSILLKHQVFGLETRSIEDRGTDLSERCGLSLWSEESEGGDEGETSVRGYQTY